MNPRERCSSLGLLGSLLLLLVLGCGGCKGQREASRSTSAASPSGSSTAPAPSTPSSVETPPRPGPSQVVLNGKLVKVHWDDGDTFSWTERPPGARKGKRFRARIFAMNTLESYGPVHQWGTWTATELYALAKEAGRFASARGWVCERTGKTAGYGRVGMRCDGFARQMIAKGLAHVFAVDAPASAELLSVQAKAQEKKVGMWAKGVPEGIVTSLHSMDEKPGKKTAYDRVTSTRTGAALPQTHTLTYRPCDKVCRDGSCVIYIPFKKRYGVDKLRCPVN